MITLSIDVTLLQKARFKEVIKRDGKKAIYAELVMVETPNSQYGDYIVKQSCTKEERAARVEMPILGNGKIWAKQGAQPQARRAAQAPAPQNDVPPQEGDDVPF